MPAASVAFTLNVWLPSARPVNDAGLVQAEKPPASSSHLKVEPPSVDVKLKLAEVELLGFDGLAVMEVFGATVSIVHV